MASLPVYDMSGSKVGSYEIDPSEIAPKINKQLLHDAVVMYQANQRQGSACTKTRGMVAGSTKKLYRQKGTGNARAGTRKSGIRRGGGHIMALSPRDYSYRLNKKAVKLATRMAIAGKVQDEQVVVVDDMKMDAPKTKAVVAMLESMGLGGGTALIATDGHNPVVYKSARNISGVTVLPASDLNALAILTPKAVVIAKSALDAIKQGSAASAAE